MHISLNYIPDETFDNKSSLVEVMAWCWTGNKPLYEPMLTQFSNVCHPALRVGWFSTLGHS